MQKPSLPASKRQASAEKLSWTGYLGRAMRLSYVLHISRPHGPPKRSALDGCSLRSRRGLPAFGSYATISYVGEGSTCSFAAYLISKEQLSRLDTFEGELSHYIRIGMPFTSVEGESLLGHVYVANPERLTVAEHPSLDYLEHIRTGYEEHGFDT